MLLKAGVDISRLKNEIRRRLNVIASDVEAVTGSELVITSTYEGTHSPSSLHYANLAIDIRARYKKHELAERLQKDLGENYFVLVEPTHIHIHYKR